MSSVSGEWDNRTGNDDAELAQSLEADEVERAPDVQVAEEDERTVLGYHDRSEHKRIDDESATFSHGYRAVPESVAEIGEVNEASTLPPRPSIEGRVSFESSVSGLDDAPSVQESTNSPSHGSIRASAASSRLSPSPSPQTFDRRFQARLPSSSPLGASSPGFLTHRSRQSSISSQLTIRSQAEADPQSEDKQQPWDVVRWTKLKKISSQLFSEAGKRTFGRPTFLTVAASIAVGTSKGILLLFDYQQTLKSIIGQGTAAECGSVTSLAISADHSTVAAGHANGTIFTWEISRPARPLLHIPAIDRSHAEGRKSDGHVVGSAVLHVGFLGMRHTALVSADDSGMAFSHLASRGLGVVGRSVTTTRILGRYPEILKTSLSSRKPSSVLAFSPLPFGNVEQFTDNLGLTALLTPYLLVIVSTTPIAQTQFKSPRPKDNITAHSAMTGSLAWFPAVKLRDDVKSQSTSKTKLAFCWSNVLSVLEVDENEDAPDNSGDGSASLHFKTRSRWKGDEAIVTLQWLSRSVLALLTVSQRLIILEDPSMRLAETSDLNQKHIYHQDLFSRQLQPLVEKTDQEDYSMHGVIPDAFHMSFKAYKGRLFLLGTNDVSMGTLSNWADRLVSLMETSNFVAAIELATAYHNGVAEKLTVGLPEDDTLRQSLVRPRLLEMISASLRYVFNDEDLINTEQELRGNYESLARVAFAACLSMKATDFLFDEVYEWYSDASVQDIFLTTLEPYILDGKVVAVPPTLLKDLMNWYGSLDMTERLEEMICSLQTDTMDIDQVTSICKQYHLYDALIYVWNQALGDYVTPLIDLMSLGTNIGNMQQGSDNTAVELERKMFPYMAFTLTGRDYPRGSEMFSYDATRAKASLYGLLFSKKTIRWPQPNGRLIRVQPDQRVEASYPYLRFFLRFDAFNFLSMLNEAFEDSFLNEGEQQLANGTDAESHNSAFDMSINRGRIIDVLLEVVSEQEFTAETKIILDIFIARNVAKYPGIILLPDPLLRSILIELCHNTEVDLADECQLSVEYLLSVFQPVDLQELAPLFREAGYFRVLKSVYRGSRQYAKWLETHFDDTENRNDVFGCIQDCLRPTAGLNRRQIGEVKAVIESHAQDLAELDVERSATCLRDYAPDLLEPFLNRLNKGSQVQYMFLKSILEQPILHPDESVQPPETFRTTHTERYVQLMCHYEPQQVAQVISMLKADDLHLDKVLPAMEEGGAVDAAIMLMAKDGLVRDAMERLKKHLRVLGTALSGLIKKSIESPEAPITQETADHILEDLRKYVKVGVWLCHSHTGREQRLKTPKQHRPLPPNRVSESDLSTEELLWLDLIDTVVVISRDAASSSANMDPADDPSHDHFDVEDVSDAIRAIVQDTFTVLLASTAAISKSSLEHGREAAPPSKSGTATPSRSPDHRFLRILRTFLARAARNTPSLADLRKVLSDIFSAYAFEETMLALAHDFVDKDVFVDVAEADRKRRAGWRPRAQICERCRRRAWGAGAGQGIWQAWRVGSEHEEMKRRARLGIGPDATTLASGEENGKGKSRASEEAVAVAEDEETDTELPKPDSLVLFSCCHLFHKKCLEQAMAEKGLPDKEPHTAVQDRFQCPLCK